MKRLLALLVLLAVWLTATPADACHRCGIFGRGCRFNHVPAVIHAAPYVAPAYGNQTFNFINSYPLNLIPGGNSVYGYNLAAQPLALDVPLVLDRSARLAEAFSVGAVQALNGHNANVQGALSLVDGIDRRSKNIQAFTATLQANNGAQPVQSPPSLSFRVTVGADGQPKVERLEAGKPCPDGNCPDPAIPPPSPIQAPEQPLTPKQTGLQYRGQSLGVLSAVCGKCHDGLGTKDTPLGLVIDDRAVLTPDQRKLALKKVEAGKMPPPGSIAVSIDVLNSVRAALAN
jgi:hypothetical protein